MSESVHTVVMRDRKNTEIGGVTDLISFDENSVILSTVCGGMEIEGEGLHVSVLDLSGGQVKIEGTVNGMFYYNDTEKTKKEGFFGRIFSSR